MAQIINTKAGLFKKHLPLAVVLFLCSFQSQLWAQTTLIHNIQGLTIQDNKLVEFSAIRIENDKIAEVYQKPNTLKLSKADTVINGEGKTLLPGLIDAHGHVLNYGLSLMRADLRESTSEQNAVEMAKSFADENPNQQWILGRGWNQERWTNNHFPSAKTLDQLFGNQPVYLTRVDGHAGWANTAAMKLAGISKTSKSPAGGEIIKDAQGNPTGVFIDNAMDLIKHAIAQPSIKEQEAILLKAMENLAQLGLTSVHDAGVMLETIQAYKNIDARGKMPIRVNVMVDVLDPDWQSLLKQGTYQSASKRLTINSVKISADGALGSRGAALIESYSDKANHFGLMLHDEKKLHQLIKTTMELGFQVNTHAIGDKANHIVLDDYIELIKQTKSRHLRHRVEHAQVLTSDALDKFSENDIIASMQATHATSDKNMAENRLGSERIKGAYAWNTLLAKNTIIANGSDFPVESANPFFGLHAAITRQDHNNQPAGGWYANEAMTFTQALKSFTYDAAYAGHQETLIGSLEVGKKADFILIDQNIKTANPENIWRSKVLQTWVDGKRLPSAAK